MVYIPFLALFALGFLGCRPALAARYVKYILPEEVDESGCTRTHRLTFDHDAHSWLLATWDGDEVARSLSSSWCRAGARGRRRRGRMLVEAR